MAEKVKASDCKCCICGKQAVAFWPVFEPDIPSHPYCRKCLDKEKMKALISFFGEKEGRRYFKEWNQKSKTDGR